MVIFSRLGMVAGFVGASAAFVAPAAYASPPSAPLVGMSDDAEIRLSSISSPYVALHFLGRLDGAQPGAFVRDVVGNAPRQAGVRHLFISSDARETVRTWAGNLNEARGSIYADAGSALAKELKVSISPQGSVESPTTIVLGRDGEELFRLSRDGATEYPTFNAIAQRLDQLTKVPAREHYNLPKAKDVAVEGHDVVAYFTQHKAVKGDPKIASRYRGVEYLFATTQDRELFAKDPERYLPTYGGWCASAIGAKAKKVEIDPTNFKVKDGRLFLFYKDFFSDALKDWNQHEREWEPAADANWKKIAGEDPLKPTEKKESGR